MSRNIGLRHSSHWRLSVSFNPAKPVQSPGLCENTHRKVMEEDAILYAARQRLFMRIVVWIVCIKGRGGCVRPAGLVPRRVKGDR